MNLRSRRDYLATPLPDGKSEVSSDGRTVWVNRGACLARFCPTSHEFTAIDAGNSFDGQDYEETTVQHDETKFGTHWAEFVVGVKNRWGIEVGPSHNPLYV